MDPNLTPTIYIASPFFNDKQREEVKRITSYVEACHWKALSPSRDGLVIKPDDPLDVSKKGFDWNVDAIRRSNAVLAFVDWLCPDDHEIREVCWLPELDTAVYSPTHTGYPTREQSEKMCYVHSPPLNIPDAGVIFEIGIAYMLDKPVITLTYANKPLNLMMIHSVVAHCSGTGALDQLGKVLYDLNIVMSNLNFARTNLLKANLLLTNTTNKLKGEYAFKGKII